MGFNSGFKGLNLTLTAPLLLSFSRNIYISSSLYDFTLLGAFLSQIGKL